MNVFVGLFILILGGGLVGGAIGSIEIWVAARRRRLILTSYGRVLEVKPEAEAVRHKLYELLERHRYVDGATVPYLIRDAVMRYAKNFDSYHAVGLALGDIAANYDYLDPIAFLFRQSLWYPDERFTGDQPLFDHVAIRSEYALRRILGSTLYLAFATCVGIASGAISWLVLIFAYFVYVS